MKSARYGSGGRWSPARVPPANPISIDIARWLNTLPFVKTLPVADPWVRTKQVRVRHRRQRTRIEHPPVNTTAGLVTPQTTAVYTDDFDANPAQPTFAFPTTINRPGGLVTHARFRYNLGRITQFTDPNGRITFYKYGYMDTANTDALERLTLVTQPIGTTGVSFQPNQVTTARSLDGSRAVTTEALVDGLGRPSRSVLHEAASTVTTETHYDALGRVAQVSNPYRAGDTVRWSTTTHDELDRPLDITYPDGAVARTRYSNNEAVTRDAADKWRKTVTDAFGRLTSVVEDPTATIGSYTNAGTNLSTAYAYDSRDNLGSVTQGGRDRSFTYDSLGRLLSASSPESGTSVNEGDAQDQNGTTAYEYDPAGNLTQRSDPRGLVTSLRYDVRGRLRTKSYSDTTPVVTYCYDGSAEAGCDGGGNQEPRRAADAGVDDGGGHVLS